MAAKRGDETRVETLCLDLYAAVLDGGGFAAALGSLADALGGETVLTHATRFDAGGPAAYEHLAGRRIDPADMVTYAAEWFRRDLWMQAAESAPEGVLNLSRLVPEARYARSALWNEFSRPIDGPYHALALKIDRPGRVVCAFTTHRPRRGEAFGTAEEELLAAVGPHLGRALETRARILAGARREATTEGLEALRQGVALFDLRGGLVHANAALRAMAAAGDGLALGRDGLLCPAPAMGHSVRTLLYAALAAASGKLRLLEGTGRVAVPRPSGKAAWIVEALPIRPRRDATEVPENPLVTPGFAGAMLVVTDPDRRAPPGELLLRQALGLSRAEASLAAALAAGRTLAEIGAARGLSVETLRTQLASIRRRPGCRRQADLARLVGLLGVD